VRRIYARTRGDISDFVTLCNWCCVVQFIVIRSSGLVLCLSIVDSGLRVERCLGVDVQCSYRYFWDFRLSRRKYWDVTSYSLPDVSEEPVFKMRSVW